MTVAPRADLVQEAQQDTTGSLEYQETQANPGHPDTQLTQGASCPLIWQEGLMKSQETWRCCTDHGVRLEQEDPLGQTACQGLLDLKDPLVMLVTLDQWETLAQEDLKAQQEKLAKMVRQEHQENQERWDFQGHREQEDSQAPLDPLALKDTEGTKAQWV